MENGYVLVALSSVVGLAFYGLTHVPACWVVRHRGPYVPLLIGFVCGLVASMAMSLGALLHLQSAPADLAAFSAMNLLAYLALAFGYFNFINLNIASLRIRILQELLESGGRMPEQQLLGSYNADEVAALRIARLVRGGHLVETQGRYYSGKASRFLVVARIFDALRWMILGQRYLLEPPTAAALHAAEMEGSP